MPPTASRPAYHHGDLRSQLIAAIRDLIETHGPDGFSVAEAARRAGVSSAAPYKHFRDRPEILRAVAAEGMDRLRDAMAEAADRHPPGSLAAVAAIGQAYVDFARSGPGVFRLVFGLTEGHEDDPDLRVKGEGCYGVILRSVACHLGLPPDADDVQRRTYALWSCVHGHAFLTIDRKTEAMTRGIDDNTFLRSIAEAILGPDHAPADEPGTRCAVRATGGTARD